MAVTKYGISSGVNGVATGVNGRRQKNNGTHHIIIVIEVNRGTNFDSQMRILLFNLPFIHH